MSILTLKVSNWIILSLKFPFNSYKYQMISTGTMKNGALILGIIDQSLNIIKGRWGTKELTTFKNKGSISLFSDPVPAKCHL